ncbi:hypothetical protein VitviT2T_026028 [Vitis vinifera]|uniref:Uncharacterized protein n=2 Tax=Vitis vinifera TaxID=29760 RepID=A0ABY9DLN3_VITVI|nr:hypothetical protein VitviT2T_026028 [Vitis vinifera]
MMIPIYQTSQVTEELKGTTASSRVGENQKYGTAETMGEGGFWFGEREKPKSEVVNIKRGTGAPPPPRALSQTLRVHEKWEWSSRRPMGMGGWDLMFLHIMRFCKTTTTRPENKVLYIKEGISKRDDDLVRVSKRFFWAHKPSKIYLTGQTGCDIFVSVDSDPMPVFRLGYDFYVHSLLYSNRALAKKKLIKEDEDGFRTKRHQDGIEDAGIWDMGEMGSALQPPIFEDEEGTWWGTLPIQWLVTPATSLPRGIQLLLTFSMEPLTPNRLLVAARVVFWHHRDMIPELQFQLSGGLSGTSNETVRLPKNFTLLGPGTGFTCSQATIEAPSLSLSSDGRRKTY